MAGLYNYSTCILVALPGLTSLDTLLLAQETRAAAAATALQKCLFYGMRSRMLRRSCAVLARAAATRCQVRVASALPDKMSSCQLISAQEHAINTAMFCLVHAGTLHALSASAHTARVCSENVGCKTARWHINSAAAGTLLLWATATPPLLHFPDAV